jgi:hypothetical protein
MYCIMGIGNINKSILLKILGVIHLISLGWIMMLLELKSSKIIVKLM